jgi:hypothetical protein
MYIERTACISTDTEYFVTIDANEPMFQEIAASDFMENFQVRAVADQDQLTRREQLATLDAAYAVLKDNPILALSPVYMRNATARYLEVFGLENIDEILPSEQQVIELMALQASLAKKKRVYGCESVRESETGPLSRPKLTHNFGD